MGEHAAPSDAAKTLEAAGEAPVGNMPPQRFVVHGQEPSQLRHADRRLAREMGGESLRQRGGCRAWRRHGARHPAGAVSGCRTPSGAGQCATKRSMPAWSAKPYQVQP